MYTYSTLSISLPSKSVGQLQAVSFAAYFRSGIYASNSPAAPVGVGVERGSMRRRDVGQPRTGSLAPRRRCPAINRGGRLSGHL